MKCQADLLSANSYAYITLNFLHVACNYTQKNRMEQKWGYAPSPSPMHLGLNNRPSVPPVSYPVIGALSL